MIELEIGAEDSLGVEYTDYGSVKLDPFFSSPARKLYVIDVLNSTLGNFIHYHDPVLRQYFRFFNNPKKSERLKKTHEEKRDAILETYSPTIEYLAALAFKEPPEDIPSERHVRDMFSVLVNEFITGDAILDGSNRTTIKEETLRRAAYAHADPGAKDLTRGYLNLPIYRPFLKQYGLTAKFQRV